AADALSLAQAPATVIEEEVPPADALDPLRQIGDRAAVLLEARAPLPVERELEPAVLLRAEREARPLDEEKSVAPLRPARPEIGERSHAARPRIVLDVVAHDDVHDEVGLHERELAAEEGALGEDVPGHHPVVEALDRAGRPVRMVAQQLLEED